MDRLPSELNSLGRGPGDVETGDREDRAAFGEFLRKARERRRKTLQQIANETKISSRYLRALEEGNVHSLPNGMYRRAMLRAYAQSVGLDKGAALELFERTFEHPHRVPPAARAEPGSPVTAAVRAPSRTPWLLLVGVVAAVIVIVTLTTDNPDGVGATSTPAVVNIELQGPSRPVETASAPAPAQAAVIESPSRAPVTRVSATSSRSVDEGAAQGIPSRTPSPTAARNTEAATRTLSRSATAGRSQNGGETGTAPAALPEQALPRATAGEIVIASDPAGARVTVNGTGWGVTPVRVRNIPFGEKRIRVTKDGYGSEERVVNLQPARPTATLRVSLSGRD